VPKPPGGYGEDRGGDEKLGSNRYSCLRLRLDLESVSASVLRTARTATEPTEMVVSLPPVVAVAVNLATQTSEPSVVVSPDAPLQIIKKT
jgi:hypothetical protein